MEHIHRDTSDSFCRRRHKPETFMDVPASMTPLLGRTQYLRGAVVLTLKHTFLSVGLVSFRFAVTTSVNGPEEHRGGGEENNCITQGVCLYGKVKVASLKRGQHLEIMFFFTNAIKGVSV